MTKLIKILIVILFLIGIGFVLNIASKEISTSVTKTMLETQIKEATGRDFKINGNAVISVFPPSVTLTEITFANASWAKRPQLATAERVKVGIRLIPLLFKKVYVHSIELENATVFLELNRNNKGNWELDLQQPETDEEDALVLSPSAKVKVSNLDFEFVDRSTNDRYKIKFNDIHSTIPYPLNSMKLSYNGSMKNKSFSGNATISLSNDTFDLSTSTNLLGGGMDVEIRSENKARSTTLDLKVITDKVNAGHFFNLFEITDALQEGTLKSDIDLTSSYTPTQTFISKLNGTVKIYISDSLYDTANKPGISRSFVNLLAGTEGRNRVRLNCVAGNFKLTDGIISSDMFVFDTKGAFVIGQGTINLNDERINIVLSPHAKRTSLMSLAVPMNVTGVVGNPSILPQRRAVTREILKGVLSAATGVGIIGFLTATKLENITSGKSKDPCRDALAK